jgi:hypothetical protein
MHRERQAETTVEYDLEMEQRTIDQELVRLQATLERIEARLRRCDP